MNDDEAVREVGWVAREARDLITVPVEENPDRWARFYQRKGDLLSHIGELDMATTAWEEARRIREAHPTGAGAELDAIARDLDATTSAWAAAGHPSDGPEAEAREEVFRRLHAWNEARAAGTFLGTRPPR